MDYIYYKKMNKKSRRVYKNNLNRNKQYEGWCFMDEFLLFEAHKILGNKWLQITQFVRNK
mgnify:CR=1 FL=1